MGIQRHTLRKQLSQSVRSERGIALLMVLVTMAVLTAVVAEFVYQTRVEVQMAANVRDRLKAYYLARSATNVARLILYYQGQLDNMMSNLPPQIKQFVGGGTIKLYQIFPIESDLAKALTSGEIGETFGMKGLNLGGKHGFGEFDGSFHAAIEDEYAKINVNALNSIPTYAGPTTAEILTLIGNPKYAPMFENPDADGQYNTPVEVVLGMHDWIDPDTTIDNLDQDLLLRAPFSQLAGSFFTPGVADEDSRYDTLKDPYKTKNGPFVTVDELHLIRGVSDAFMQEFGDKFTVYSDPSLLVNLSSVNDPVVMLSLICMQPENVTMCSAPGLPKVLEALAMFFEVRNLMQAMTFTVPDKTLILSIFQGYSLSFNSNFMKNVASSSDTFSVQATGEVGETNVTIRTVVKNTSAGQEILYWRIL
jgi:general secretion pathway protein K